MGSIPKRDFLCDVTVTVALRRVLIVRPSPLTVSVTLPRELRRLVGRMGAPACSEIIKLQKSHIR